MKALPGFGEQKARIFVALLGKQLGVRPPGWERAAAPFGKSGTFRSVADIDSPEALAKVRQYKQKSKAKAKAKASAVALTVPAAPHPPWGLGDRRLYLCTPDRPDLERFVEACIEGGVDIVQLREKHLPDDQLAERAALVQRVCADHGVPFILNDRPDLAAAIGADGVHVGQRGHVPGGGPARMGEHAIVGLSTHAPVELATAIGAPAPVDYISAGPVTPTPTKPGRAGTGLGYIREAGRRAPWPVWVTGGVDPDHGGRHGGGRRPALRGGALAHRGARPGPGQPRAAATDHRGVGRPSGDLSGGHRRARGAGLPGVPRWAPPPPWPRRAAPPVARSRPGR